MAVTCPQTNPAVQGPVLWVVVVTVVFVGGGLPVVFVTGFFRATGGLGVVLRTVPTAPPVTTVVVVGFDRCGLAAG